MVGCLEVAGAGMWRAHIQSTCVLAGLLYLTAGCSREPEPRAGDRDTIIRTVPVEEPTSSPPATGISLFITHPAAGVRTAPPTHAHKLLTGRDGFGVYADRAVPRQPVWQTEQSGQETTYTFAAPGFPSMRLRVTETPVDEGMQGPSASAVFEVRSAPEAPWTVAAIVPLGPLTEHMEPLPDVTGDGIPEVLRVESRVPCDGGEWAQVVSVLPKPKVLSSLHSDGKGCD